VASGRIPEGGDAVRAKGFPPQKWDGQIPEGGMRDKRIPEGGGGGGVIPVGGALLGKSGTEIRLMDRTKLTEAKVRIYIYRERGRGLFLNL